MSLDLAGPGHRAQQLYRSLSVCWSETAFFFFLHFRSFLTGLICDAFTGSHSYVQTTSSLLYHGLHGSAAAAFSSGCRPQTRHLGSQVARQLPQAVSRPSCCQPACVSIEALGLSSLVRDRKHTV